MWGSAHPAGLEPALREQQGQRLELRPGELLERPALGLPSYQLCRETDRAGH